MLLNLYGFHPKSTGFIEKLISFSLKLISFFSKPIGILKKPIRNKSITTYNFHTTTLAYNRLIKPQTKQNR